jgi:hypothetical protein
MAEIVKGRQMAEIDGDFVVFLIGAGSRCGIRSGRSATSADAEAE